MVTLAQLQAASARTGGRVQLHVDGCRKTVGPRGGIMVKLARARQAGRIQTWKTRPGDFRMPILIGFVGHDTITPAVAQYWHLAEDCPEGLE